MVARGRPQECKRRGADRSARRQNDSSDNHRNHQKGGRMIWPTPEWVEAISTAIYALVTIGGLVYIICQTKVLRRQTKIAELAAKAAKQSADTSEQSAVFAKQALKTCERADILLDGVSIEFPPNNDPGDARLVLRFKNFGRTRAKDVSFQAKMIIPETPNSWSSPAIPLPIMVMASGQEQFMYFMRFREFLNKPTFERIRKGELPLRFESWVVYRDVFGDAFTTRDVGLLDPNTFTFRVEEQSAG